MMVPAFSVDEADELPSKFDLRDEGAMTSVKTQYGGTCCIYSGMAAIESNMIKKGMADNTLDLSESHFSWFTFCKGSPDDPNDPLYGDGMELGVSGYTRQAMSVYFASSLAVIITVRLCTDCSGNNGTQYMISMYRRHSHRRT